MYAFVYFLNGLNVYPITNAIVLLLYYNFTHEQEFIYFEGSHYIVYCMKRQTLSCREQQVQKFDIFGSDSETLVSKFYNQNRCSYGAPPRPLPAFYHCSKLTFLPRDLHTKILYVSRVFPSLLHLGISSDLAIFVFSQLSTFV